MLTETPQGTCVRHPGVRVRSDNGLMTAPCGVCENEAYEAWQLELLHDEIDATGHYPCPCGPTRGVFDTRVLLGFADRADEPVPDDLPF